MVTHIDDQFMAVIEEGEVLSLTWKPSTSELTDAMFKNEASLFADIVKQVAPKFVLVDMRAFAFSLSEEVIAWRTENIIPIYNDVGVKKFAFVTAVPAVNQGSGQNTFVTESFDSTEKAVGWFGA